MEKSRRAGEPAGSRESLGGHARLHPVSYEDRDGPPQPLGPSALTMLPIHLAAVGTFLGGGGGGNSSRPDISPGQYQ